MSGSDQCNGEKLRKREKEWVGWENQGWQSGGAKRRGRNVERVRIYGGEVRDQEQ